MPFLHVLPLEKLNSSSPQHLLNSELRLCRGTQGKDQGWIEDFPKGSVGAATGTAGVAVPPAPTLLHLTSAGTLFKVPKPSENPPSLPTQKDTLTPTLSLFPLPTSTPLPADAAFFIAQGQGNSRASQAEWGLGSPGKGTAATAWWESSPPTLHGTGESKGSSHLSLLPLSPP